jgi:hypothetical protein
MTTAHPETKAPDVAYSRLARTIPDPDPVDGRVDGPLELAAMESAYARGRDMGPPSSRSPESGSAAERPRRFVRNQLGPVLRFARGRSGA